MPRERSRQPVLDRTIWSILLGIGLTTTSVALAGPEGDPPTQGAPAPAPTGPAPASATPSPTPDPDAPSPDDAIFLDPKITGEAIYVWDERPDKPFDRTTELRLTGAELARRGATNLADAIDLLPDVVVRSAGRGGRQIEIRGARKGSVTILIDGVPVSDPYYGNLDVSAIPITDVVEIRVSTSPASPIDGPGGPGGVIEVHTRDAIGSRLAVARALGTSLPSAEASATGRAMLGDHLAARLSATGTLGRRDYDLLAADRSPVQLGEDRQGEAGAARLELRHGRRRAALDLALQYAAYAVPPGSDVGTSFLVVDGETQGRASLALEDHIGGWRLLGRGYLALLQRRSKSFDDPALTNLVRSEDLSARRIGVSTLANRALGHRYHVIGAVDFDTEHASVDGFDGSTTAGTVSVLEPAAGLQYEDHGLKLDGAVGAAVPFGIAAGAWPEAKLQLTYRPGDAFSARLTGARKGRLPTLRERFEPGQGNQALDPEQVWFGELALHGALGELATVDVSPYVRRQNGLIKFDSMTGALANIDAFTAAGVDLAATIRPGAALSGGATYGYVDVRSAKLGGDVLDFLPHHKASAWLSGQRARGGATVRLRYQSREQDGGQTLPAYTSLDASGYLQLGEYQAGLRLDNLMGRRYLERRGVDGLGRVVMVSVEGTWK